MQTHPAGVMSNLKGKFIMSVSVHGSTVSTVALIPKIISNILITRSKLTLTTVQYF